MVTKFDLWFIENHGAATPETSAKRGDSMRYVGGKSRGMKGLFGVLADAYSPGMRYVEPFMGGGAAFRQAMSALKPTQAACGDYSEDLMLLWGAVRDGYAGPETMTKARYQALKNAEPSPERTAAGFGLSFSGKWFGGYLGDDGTVFERPNNPPMVQRPLKALREDFAKMRPLLQQATLFCGPYWEGQPGKGDLVYCDPPYANTTGYDAVGSFDSSRFWDWADRASKRGARVFVSEYSAPSHWTTVWSATKVSSMRTLNGVDSRTVECLFTREP